MAVTDTALVVPCIPSCSASNVRGPASACVLGAGAADRYARLTKQRADVLPDLKNNQSSASWRREELKWAGKAGPPDAGGSRSGWPR
jgi:hypothetical protein